MSLAASTWAPRYRPVRYRRSPQYHDDPQCWDEPDTDERERMTEDMVNAAEDLERADEESQR